MAATPAIDYTSRDFEGLRASMLTYAQAVLPEWTSRSTGDLGVLMVELMAYVGDILSYYVDRAQEEAYLQTATLDSSIVSLANMLGYVPRTGVAATGTVTLALDASQSSAVVPPGTTLVTYAPTGEVLYFETTNTVVLNATTRSATANVRHGQTVTLRPLGSSTGLPGQSYILDDLPILNNTITISVDYATSSTEAWTRVDHLADYGPNDKVYTVAAASKGRLRVKFGDGINGALPSVGLRIYATYVRGGGTVANLPANTTMTIDQGAPLGVGVAVVGGSYQTGAMSGGLDADEIEDIRQNVPAALRMRDRAVTLKDYVDMALLDPAILKANAVVRSPQSIYVYALTTDQLEVNAKVTRTRVQKYLAPRAPAGVVVSLFPAVQKTFTVGSQTTPLAVTAYETYQNTSVTLAVIAALQARYNQAYLGMPITASDIYGTIIAVPGVRSCAVPSWQVTGFLQDNHDTILNPWELPVLSSVYVNVTGGVV